MAKQKYYVVWIGLTPGIYDSWVSCQEQIKGYPGARYKSYKTKNDAEEAYSDGPPIATTKKKKIESIQLGYPKKVILSALAVDAACSGNPGKMEYQGVYVEDKAQIFHIGPLQNGTNNIGEFLAIVHALALLDNQKSDTKTIYSDSRTAMLWVKKKKANTKLKKTASSAIVYKMIDKAEAWLRSHTYQHKLVKWDTKKWGEIPADFGRK